ncbi:unnamed protein product, partial [marine sediment metagenome]
MVTLSISFSVQNKYTANPSKININFISLITQLVSIIFYTSLKLLNVTIMKEPNVSAAIMSAEEVEFILYGDFECSGFSEMFNGNLRAHISNGMITLRSDDHSFSSSPEILLSPIDPISESFLLKNVTIGLQFHWEQKQNQRFSGSLKLIIENNKLTVINLVPVEKYLTSVISSEMSATSSSELLKAHAIVSRSWLLAQINKRKSLENEETYVSEFICEEEIIRWYDREDHTLYDVCADDHCQRYQGITREHTHNAQEAVEETRGFILMYNDQICDTRFSKSCGGITETFENVWEK